MSKVLNVEVVTRSETLWSGSATHVSIPAEDGMLGILPGRQPVLAILQNGIVEIREESGGNVKLHVTGGFASVDVDFVTIVVEEGTKLEA
jgi:F0F1-type ATP synthase, epsilon subunit (mitochondrial delta subunit)